MRWPHGVARTDPIVATFWCDPHSVTASSAKWGVPPLIVRPAKTKTLRDAIGELVRQDPRGGAVQVGHASRPERAPDDDVGELLVPRVPVAAILRGVRARRSSPPAARSR